jgi:hypothetical protein
MILTLRTWHVDRAHYDEFARISEEDYWPVFDGLAGRALGIWARRVGGPERLVLMTRYESLEHWLGTRAWGGAAANLAELSARRDRMIRDTDLVALKPLSHRQPAADAPEDQPGVYVLETFRVLAEDCETFRELTEDDWRPWAEALGGIRLVGIWRSYIGPQDLVYVLTRADDVGTWEERCDPDDAPDQPLADRADLAEPVDVQLLYPVTQRRP